MAQNATVTTFGPLIDSWREHPDSADCVVDVRTEPERPAMFDDLDPPPPAVISSRLAEAGIERLYRHQVAAIRSIRSGTHTVIVAGTSSGKSLAYQLPIAEAMTGGGGATALLVFPTKALSRDQLRGLHRIGSDDLVPAVYDGDTPAEDRKWARKQANAVLTNPDMLHVGILPNHTAWSRFLSRLRFVVVDELHTLRGAFGTHTALVLRRLRRLAAANGSEPTFIFTSATIGNPGELAASLIAAPVQVVDQDTSPTGPRTFVLWNPELEDEITGRRASPLGDATRVFSDLVAADVPSILFARSRRATELTYIRAKDRLDPQHAARIAPYRAGYRPEQRREIEERLFSGDLLGVTTTNALELGIDIGTLDASVLSTFPGTIASFRQQSGRAGRTSAAALTVLVAGQDQLDQYYMNHPDDLFARSPEAVVINPANPTIAAGHIECAAHEAPLTPEDRAWFGDGFEELVTDLVSRDRLGIREGRVFWRGGRSPAGAMDLRGAGGGSYVIIDDVDGILGTVDEGRAFTQTHEGAVYLHQGDAYVVTRLDVANREVRVRGDDPGYYTQPKVEKDLAVASVTERSRLGAFGLGNGMVEVETHVIEYRRKDVRTGAIIDTIPLDLPARRFRTQAVWYTMDDAMFENAGVDVMEVPGTLHAMEHCAIGILPVLAVCDRWDIGGLSTAFHADTAGPAFFIYDGYPGGTGIAPLAYDLADRHLRVTLETIERCPCATGCPSCVQSPKCGNFNDPLDKEGARRMLRLWAEG
jgi:DEAD/DEAH box helicase domain-containing protein